MNTEIQGAYNRVHAAERERDRLIRRTYRVGTTILYGHGSNLVTATVVGHRDDRLKVRGANSGREYWIYAYRVFG